MGLIIPLRPHPWDAFGPPAPLEKADLTDEQMRKITELEDRIAKLQTDAEEKQDEAEGLKSEAQELEREAEGLFDEVERLEEELKELRG
jgi:septal ring factor EnvC (AmiA/AmiB activator)